MPEKNDGGFAFPNVTRISCPGGEVSKITGGMTLRDWFAGQALIGIRTKAYLENKENVQLRIAAEAYRQADAMLKEREK